MPRRNLQDRRSRHRQEGSSQGAIVQAGKWCPHQAACFTSNWWVLLEGSEPETKIEQVVCQGLCPRRKRSAPPLPSTCKVRLQPTVATWCCCARRPNHSAPDMWLISVGGLPVDARDVGMVGPRLWEKRGCKDSATLPMNCASTLCGWALRGAAWTTHSCEVLARLG